ncbi:MAG: glycosyltransferase family 39 protein [Anaerolineae bacterium]|nr:glycosyltransferase family 39 protein [Anaerolineae bacterium]
MKRTALIALVCVFAAFVLSNAVSRDVFERLPHLEDEFAYLFQARVFARGQVYINTPTPVRAYWQPFLINYDAHRFGKYTPGWPLLLAVGAGWGQPWIVNAWLAMLTVALVYRLGREIYNPQTGAVAAILTASSPAALLLNGTLMAHTATLFWVTLYLYAAWRVERGRYALAWSLVGGTAFGMALITRPLTAVGVVIGLVLIGGLTAAWMGMSQVLRRGWRTVVLPWIVFSAAAGLITLIWPLYNYAVTARDGETFPAYMLRFMSGDKDTNLYRYVWDYDRIGFGEGHGRRDGGHTIEAGWRHTKKDMPCVARDLFGWARAADDATTLAGDGPCLDNGPGFSWVLLPVGLLLGIRRRWTWVLAAVPAGIVVVYLAYWIGGTLYSARYYYEALTAAALITAFAITEIARLLGAGYRQVSGPVWFSPAWIVYAAVIVGAIYAAAVFAPARMQYLRGYGRISQAQLDELNAKRQDPDTPLVVIAWGDHHWREVATYMAVTSPFRDSDIVLARDPDKWNLGALLDQWPDRELIYYFDGALMASLPPDELERALADE